MLCGTLVHVHVGMCVCVCVRVCVLPAICFQTHERCCAQVFHWDCVRITRDDVVHTLHARREYFGRHRNDFVHVRAAEDANNGPWLARLQAFIKVDVPEGQEGIAAGYLPLAIVQWLDRDPVDVVPGIPTYKYLPHPQAISIEAIVRPVHLLDSPCVAADGEHRVCALPYGKSAAFNALFV